MICTSCLEEYEPKDSQLRCDLCRNTPAMVWHDEEGNKYTICNPRWVFNMRTKDKE